MAIAGTIRQVILDKINYNANAEIDLSRTTGAYTWEGQATSGDTTFKGTKQVEIIEGVDIDVDGAQRENIRDLASGIAQFDMAYVTTNGDTYTASGKITITGDSTADAKMTITMIPAGLWVPIVV